MNADRRWKWIGLTVHFQEFKSFEAPLYTLFNRFSMVEFQLGILFILIIGEQYQFERKHFRFKYLVEAWLKFSCINIFHQGRSTTIINLHIFQKIIWKPSRYVGRLNLEYATEKERKFTLHKLSLDENQSHPRSISQFGLDHQATAPLFDQGVLWSFRCKHSN